MFARLKSHWLIPGCIAVIVLTVLAALLQYHWIDNVSNSDRRQRRDFLAATLGNFSVDFRDTILRPLPFFRSPPITATSGSLEPHLLELAHLWRGTTDRPRLLGSINIGYESETGVVFKRLSGNA